MTSQWNANPTAYLDRPRSVERLRVSLEMFPPANEVAGKGFDRALGRLRALDPEFVSITSGAGGDGSCRTLETISRIGQRYPLPCAAHLTCIGKSRQQIDRELDAIRDAGVDHVVALRGDLPQGGGKPAVDGFQSALQLVRLISARDTFSISVAAYPEGHPEANNVAEEIRYLKRKVDAGADRIITQFFFDSEVFARFIDRVRDAGIEVPVLPGILPIVNFQSALRFAEKCGTRIPRWYHEMYRDLSTDGELHRAISTSIAVEQCRQLMALGIRDLHFYTLNQSELTLAICRELGIPAGNGESTAPVAERAVRLAAHGAGGL